MRVLDLDLDFFLADLCPMADLGARPDGMGREPWSRDRIRRYLEQNLLMDRAHPLKGRIFETHDKALSFWQELIDEGELSVPFTVTHVDAHSDLGIAYPGASIVLNNALCQRLDKRRDIAKYYALNQLTEANYLLFALAFRWIERLENVRNPKSAHDMPREIIFKTDANGAVTSLKLEPPLRDLFYKMNGCEPEIEYAEFICDEYRAESPFDFVSLALSPRYAPVEADAIVHIFKEYIDIID